RLAFHAPSDSSNLFSNSASCWAILSSGAASNNSAAPSFLHPIKRIGRNNNRNIFIIARLFYYYWSIELVRGLTLFVKPTKCIVLRVRRGNSRRQPGQTEYSIRKISYHVLLR